MLRLSNTVRVEFRWPKTMFALWKRFILEGRTKPLLLSIGFFSFLGSLVFSLGIFSNYENHQLEY